MDPRLYIEKLGIEFALKDCVISPVQEVSFVLKPNHTLALVGESGCGKSLTGRAILRILPRRARISNGSIELTHPSGVTPIHMLSDSSRTMRRIRGGEIAMIFQEPTASLSPVHTIGNLVDEVLRIHRGGTAKSRRQEGVILLERVGVPSPSQRYDAYPHELSGGLRQRAMIAIALAGRPKFLIADEPTTAIDPTVQAQILQQISELQSQTGMGVLLITHDMGVVAQCADEVAVMYRGRIVEQAPVKELYSAPKHPYTRGLLESIPRLDRGYDEPLKAIPGTVPPPHIRLNGCPFHPRCPERLAGVCDKGDPPSLIQLSVNHSTACHLYTDSFQPRPLEIMGGSV